MFPKVPLTREPKCTQAIDPGASGSTLTPVDTSWPSPSSLHFANFPWPGSPWLAHGSPLHGNWFRNPRGLLLGAICQPSFPGSQPRDVRFPFATSHHPARPIPCYPCFSVLQGLVCGPCHTPFLVPSSFLIPHSVFIPHQATSNPVARAHRILIHTGTVSCGLHGWIILPPCVWVVRFLLDLLGAPPPGPFPVFHPVTRAYTPPGRLHPLCILHPAACYPVSLACGSFSCPVHRLLLPFPPLRVCSVLCALRRCSVVFFFVFVCLLFFRGPPPLCLSTVRPLLWIPVPAVFFFTLLPACTHVITALVIGSRLPSVFISGPFAHAGRAPWQSRPSQVGAPPSRHSPLFPLSPPLPALPPSPVSRPLSYCCSPASCAIRCSSPRHGCISRALRRLSASVPFSVL